MKKYLDYDDLWEITDPTVVVNRGNPGCSSEEDAAKGVNQNFSHGSP